MLSKFSEAVITGILLLVFEISCARSTHEIQVGLSHGILRTRITNNYLQPKTITLQRNKFFLQPTLRYTYNFNLWARDSLPKVRMCMFIGYSIFGGKSKADTSEYKDKIIFHTLELGVCPSMYLIKNVSIGIAFKVNYTPLVLSKYYGTIYQSYSVPRKWLSENSTEHYKKFTTNFGVIGSYKIKRFTLSFETWIGLSNISNLQSDIYTQKITERNCKMLIGYNF